ncbi:MAG: hypothetical protein U0641_16680 [Anaerolineae bacterium]
MSDDVVIGALIDRLLAKRPDLWSGLQFDPLGALEDAGIRVTDEERAALERAGHIEASALHVKRSSGDDALAAALKADLAAARAAQSLDFNPLAAESHTEEPAAKVDEDLLAEQRRLRAQAEKMRAQLAEEKAHLAKEREAALKRLGGGKK